MNSQHTPPDTEAELESECSPQQRRLDEKHERAAKHGAQVDKEEPPSSDEEMVHLKVFRYDPDVEAKQDPRFDGFHGTV